MTQQNRLELAGYMTIHNAKETEEELQAAIGQLERMLDDIKRELTWRTDPIERVDSVRRTLVWAVANTETHLSNAAAKAVALAKDMAVIEFSKLPQA